MKVPNNTREKSSQKFTFVRLFEFYSSSVTQQSPNAFGIALAAPSVLAMAISKQA
jgi:hypothetical protein